MKLVPAAAKLYLDSVHLWNWHYYKSVDFIGQKNPDPGQAAHKSHNALDKYTTMQHFVAEMYTHGIVGCWIVAFVQQIL